jgi:membrane-associated protease RseP (regulator of RpoE activity)
MYGADIVLYQSEYLGSRTDSVPITSYQPGRTSTTQHSGVAQVNPSPIFGGPVVGYAGTSVTEEPGTYSTTYVPVTVDRYSHVATFWRKARPSRFGVSVVALPDDLRRSLERNTGVLVMAVVDDSPAFRANILPGDVLVGIDSAEIESLHDFTRKLDAFAGKQCNVVLIRNGEERLIPVKMNRR